VGPVEVIVVILVVGLRLLLPLAIPYYPLVGVVACLVLDAVDQTVFQQFPAIELEGYQQYDKALDIYYLAITYLSTMRNWTSRPAFQVSRFLYYYRLVGVVAFELTQIRALLLIFPNTFEYFFIFVEAVRLRWNMRRIGIWTAIIGAAAIWIFIKLPQEWWIHIAKLDMTEFIGDQIAGGSPTVLVLAGIVLVGLIIAGWWVVRHKTPPGDHGPRLTADPLPAELRGPELYRLARARSRVFDAGLFEKVVLIGLVSVVFAQILVGEDVNNIGIIAFVAVFVPASALASQWLARRGRAWNTVAVELVGMALVNFGILFVFGFLQRVLGIIETSAPLITTIFFLFLLTVLIVLFDRYRTVALAREEYGMPSHGSASPRE